MGSNPKSVGFIMTFFNKVNDFEWFQSSIFTVPYCMKLFAFFATSMFCTLHRRNNSLHPCHRAFRVSSITKWVKSLYKIALTSNLFATSFFRLEFLKNSNSILFSGTVVFQFKQVPLSLLKSRVLYLSKILCSEFEDKKS